MRAVIQRVLEASVAVNEEVVGSIKSGFLVLLGVAKDDSAADINYIVEKIAGLRIFEDEQGKMNLGLADVNGEVLLVSQFTLLGDARQGRRPGFVAAALPELANEYYQRVKAGLEQKNIRVETGVFQAEMQVSLVNDGPITILLDSKKLF